MVAVYIAGGGLVAQVWFWSGRKVLGNYLLPHPDSVLWWPHLSAVSAQSTTSSTLYLFISGDPQTSQNREPLPILYYSYHYYYYYSYYNYYTYFYYEMLVFFYELVYFVRWLVDCSFARCHRRCSLTIVHVISGRRCQWWTGAGVIILSILPRRPLHQPPRLDECFPPLLHPPCCCSEPVLHFFRLCWYCVYTYCTVVDTALSPQTSMIICLLLLSYYSYY